MVDRQRGRNWRGSQSRAPYRNCVGRVLCRKEKWQRSPLTNEYDGEIILRTFFGLSFFWCTGRTAVCEDCLVVPPFGRCTAFLGSWAFQIHGWPEELVFSSRGPNLHPGNHLFTPSTGPSFQY